MSETTLKIVNYNRVDLKYGHISTLQGLGFYDQNNEPPNMGRGAQFRPQNDGVFEMQVPNREDNNNRGNGRARNNIIQDVNNDDNINERPRRQRSRSCWGNCVNWMEDRLISYSNPVSYIQTEELCRDIMVLKKRILGKAMAHLVRIPALGHGVDYITESFNSSLGDLPLSDIHFILLAREEGLTPLQRHKDLFYRYALIRLAEVHHLIYLLLEYVKEYNNDYCLEGFRPATERDHFTYDDDQRIDGFNEEIWRENLREVRRAFQELEDIDLLIISSFEQTTTYNEKFVWYSSAMIPIFSWIFVFAMTMFSMVMAVKISLSEPEKIYQLCEDMTYIWAKYGLVSITMYCIRKHKRLQDHDYFGAIIERKPLMCSASIFEQNETGRNQTWLEIGIPFDDRIENLSRIDIEAQFELERGEQPIADPINFEQQEARGSLKLRSVIPFVIVPVVDSTILEILFSSFASISNFSILANNWWHERLSD